MGNSVSPTEVKKPESRIKVVENNTLTLIIGGFAAAIFILLAFFLLNYFNVISLSTIYPNQFGWLPHGTSTTTVKKTIDPNTPVMKIDEKTITYAEYGNVLSYMLYSLKEKKIATEQTNSLFIQDELLKKEAFAQNHPFQKSEFDIYLKKQGFLNDSVPQRLEFEVAYLKEKLFNSTLTWYSGQYFLVRFENSLSTSPEEKKNRAKVKIDEIRSKFTTNIAFRDLVNSYLNDKELDTLNDGQGFAGTFDHMSLGNPTVTAPELLQQIQKLQTGETSKVFIFSDPKRQGVKEPVPFAYGFVKLTDSSQGLASSYDAWLDNAKRKSTITIRDYESL